MEMRLIAGSNDMEWSVNALQESSNRNVLRNYTLTTEVYTVQDYMDEADARWEDVVIEHGAYVRCFVRAVLQDKETDFMWRVFAPVGADNFVAHAMATHEATMMLMQEYYAYLESKGLA